MCFIFKDNSDTSFFHRLSVYLKEDETSKKLEESEQPEEEKEKKEEVKPPPGIPINIEEERRKEEEKKAREAKAKKEEEKKAREEQERKAREQREKERKAQEEKLKKEKLTKKEQEMIAKFGGQILDMGKIEGKEYRGSVFINAPKQIILDENGKPKKPRLVFHFNGNGGTAKIGRNTDSIMKYVEEMRKKGDPVVLVWMTDGTGAWKGLRENPKQFEDIAHVAETATGQKVEDAITLTSYSAGYRAIGPLLHHYQEKSKTDPEAAKVYKRIRRIGLFDSAYAHWDEIAQWAAREGNMLSSNFTTHLFGGNIELQNRIKALGGDMKRVHMTAFNGDHGGTISAFEQFTGVAIPELEEEEKVPEIKSDKEFIAALERCKTNEERQRLILENLPDNAPPFEPVKMTKGGITVEFRVAKHELRIGDIGVPMDGPTALAAARLYDCTLPPYWLVERIHEQAQADGKAVPFMAAPAVAKRLHIPWNPNNPDGEKMRSARFLKAHNDLIREWGSENGVTDNILQSGHYKDVVLPVPGTTRSGNLEIFCPTRDAGGKRIQGLSGGAHGSEYYDYSHRVRLVKNTVYVDGKPMSMQEFMADKKYAKVFGFAPVDISQVYPQPEWMKKIIEERISGEESKPPEQTVEPEPQLAPEEEVVPQPPPVPIPESEPAPETPRIPEPSPEPEYIPEPSVPAAITPTPKPKAKIESGPKKTSSLLEIPKIEGSTLFLGDSITVGVAGRKSLSGVEKKESIAKKDETSHWLLKQVETLAKTDPEKLKSFDNAVMLIGTNDIGSSDDTATIFSRIEKIYKILKDHDVRIYACTIPPFKGYAGYKKRFEALNKKRKDINERIKASIFPYKVIDLAASVDEGGLADPEEPDRLLSALTGDNLHIHKENLASLYAQAIEGSKPEKTAKRTDVPEGYRPMKPYEENQKIYDKAEAIRKKHQKDPLFTTEPFEMDGKKYMARVETHGPKPSLPRKHRGVTVYIEEETA
jgi:lysophospholipase L1-like esterase